LELLEACREEFHRRLKVYHAWKSKNRKGKNPSALDDKNDDADEERAPQDILNNCKFKKQNFESIISLF
jgi:myosin-6